MEQSVYPSPTPSYLQTFPPDRLWARAQEQLDDPRVKQAQYEHWESLGAIEGSEPSILLIGRMDDGTRVQVEVHHSTRGF
jgi:hypothetical protein